MKKMAVKHVRWLSDQFTDLQSAKKQKTNMIEKNVVCLNWVMCIFDKALFSGIFKQQIQQTNNLVNWNT